MKPNLSIDASAVLVLAALAAAGLAAWKIYGGVKGALPTGQQALDAINPASTGNLIYRGANGVGSWLSGDEDYSLGSHIYELGVVPKINPANPENIVYSSLNALGNWIDGTQDETFGGWLYSATHPDPMKMPYTSTVIETNKRNQPRALAGRTQVGGGTFG